MASAAKIALMFTLMVAMAMAAQASTHNVSCTNKYCKPITVNGVVVGVNVTVDIPVNKTLTLVVPNIHGKGVVGNCSCPPDVTAVALLELGVDLVVEVTACTLPSLLRWILGRFGLGGEFCL